MDIDDAYAQEIERWHAGRIARLTAPNGWLSLVGLEWLKPGGNRVEIANAGARLMLAPDWKPIVWTEAERRKGQAWGLRTVESFHTHGTPPVPPKQG